MVFYTAKWIEVPDSKLGRLYNLLLVLVLAGVFWKSVVNKAYLEYDSPVGFINAKVTKWDGGKQTPPYCAGGIGCRVLDEYQVQYPHAQESSLLLTTRIKEDRELQDANGLWHRNSSRSFFVQDVEDFVIKVEHSFEAPNFREDDPENARLYGGSSRMMAGILNGVKGDPTSLTSLHGFTRELSNNGKADAFTLGELVGAAGVSLEDLADGKDDEDEAIRSRGMVLMVRISYHNQRKRHWSTSAPQYKYTVTKVPYTEFKLAEPATRSTSEDGVQHRLLWKRFGVKIIFVQTGRIARFSLNSLVMELVAGLALLSMAQLACDLYAYHFDPALRSAMMAQVPVYKETKKQR